jgi:sulfonate transport system substrate-binding protein
MRAYGLKREAYTVLDDSTRGTVFLSAVAALGDRTRVALLPSATAALGARAAIVLVAFAALTACSSHDTSAPSASAKIPLTAPLPETVPPNTRLVIGDPITQRVLQYTGWDKELPFQVEWAHIQGGPATTEAFSAKAIDVGSAANMPPIHAQWIGIPVKIIAIRLHQDPANHPLYVLGVAPKSQVRTTADLRGKKIAFSPGQIQGEVVLRTLLEHDIPPSEVTLVELPSSGDVYVNALVDHLVDVAPLAAGAVSKRFIDNFAKDGGKLLKHAPFRDDLTVLYVRQETLENPAKAAALRAYVRLWARAAAWEEAHPQEFAQKYWIDSEGLSQADAEHQIKAYGPRYIPSDWSEAIALEQGSIDLLAKQTSRERFDAAEIFDRRFEKLALNP